ncbi:MAG: alcohol dehydrogenase catalytic domain-containing protein [Chloroflexi bacterium]|nr:alcohol dehydrogenase catalytic domain-containing protein [Chloroflexota bacterium]
MKAIQLIELTKHIPRYLLTKAVGAVYPPACWGPLAMVQYREVSLPALPGTQWVKIKTRYGGICGSDMNAVLLKVNPALSAVISLPITLGHENVGIIAEVGQQVEGFAPGDRVVADPLLPCATRGIEEPCGFCQRGEFSLCQNFAEGDLAPGLGIGFCRDTGGSWSSDFVAHQSQLFHVPENVSDENALMVEPFSVALHPVMRNFPDDDDTALVLGAGTAGLCTVAALRALGSGARVIVMAKYRFQGEMAQVFDADEIIYLREGDVFQAVAEATGGKLYRPVLGKRVLVGGADIVYECVGNRDSVDDSLRLARSGGTVVLMGMAGILQQVDWTPIWLNELTVKGSVWGGAETFQGRQVRTIQLALEWMAEGKLDLSPMVTHRFKLEDYKRALAVTANKGRHQVIKSVFVFD